MELVVVRSIKLHVVEVQKAEKLVQLHSQIKHSQPKMCQEPPPPGARDKFGGPAMQQPPDVVPLMQP